MVEFSEDKSVEAVPVSWFTSADYSKCFWPDLSTSKSDRVTNLIKQRKDPEDTKCGWKVYRVERVMGWARELILASILLIAVS